MTKILVTGSAGVIGAVLVLTACDWNYSRVCIEERPVQGMIPGVDDYSICVRYRITRTGPDGGVITEER